MTLAALPESRPSIQSIHPQTRTPCVFPTLQRRNFPPEFRAKQPKNVSLASHGGNSQSLGRPPGMGEGRGIFPNCSGIFPEFSPPVPSHGFMVLDHHGELGIGIQRDSLQIPLESLEKRGGRSRDQLPEVENPNPKSPWNHGIPKAEIPGKSTGKRCPGKSFSLAVDSQE